MKRQKLQEQTKKLALTARDMRKKGMTHEQIATEMTKLGFKNRSGNDVTPTNVWSYLKGKLRDRQPVKTVTVKPKAPARSDELELIELIAASRLNADRKVKAIRQVLG